MFLIWRKSPFEVGGIMVRDFTYAAILTPAATHAPAETGFVVTFPDLPEAITQGETAAEALAEAADCLEEAIANRTRRHMDIPPPSPTQKGQHPVTVRASIVMKAALSTAMRES
jgi:antitoxin HicB